MEKLCNEADTRCKNLLLPKTACDAYINESLVTPIESFKRDPRNENDARYNASIILQRINNVCNVPPEHVCTDVIWKTDPTICQNAMLKQCEPSKNECLEAVKAVKPKK